MPQRFQRPNPVLNRSELWNWTTGDQMGCEEVDSFRKPKRKKPDPPTEPLPFRTMALLCCGLLIAFQFHSRLDFPGSSLILILQDQDPSGSVVPELRWRNSLNTDRTVRRHGRHID